MLKSEKLDVFLFSNEVHFTINIFTFFISHLTDQKNLAP